MIIYMVTNKVNGKIYVGQTKQGLRRRRIIHYNEAKSNRSPNSAFHKAIRKYGKSSFEWEILCECNSFDEMNEMESYYIKKHGSYVKENGYNMTMGGDGTRGYSPSDETREKMSNSSYNKGKVGFFKGHKHTEDSIQRSTRRGSDNGNSKKWLLTDPDNIQMCIVGMFEFCRDNGLSQPNMKAVSAGRRHHHKGWKAEEIYE